MENEQEEEYYLLIVYKPDSADYCKGCHMASYPGAFHKENHLDRPQLVSQIADYLFRNMNLRINEAGYEIHVYQDGFQIIENESSNWDGHARWSYQDENYPENFYELEQKYEEYAFQIMTEAKSLAAKLKAEQEQKQQEEKNKTQQAKAEEALRVRRAQFEALKREFQPEEPPR